MAAKFSLCLATEASLETLRFLNIYESELSGLQSSRT